MKHLVLLSVAATLSLTAPTLAQNGNGKGNGPKAAQSQPAAAGCPPGLAKKNLPCVPPGQARKAAAAYRVGDRLSGDYIVVDDYDRYGLLQEGGERYYRDDEVIYRVDSDTRRILDIIALADLIVN